MNTVSPETALALSAWFSSLIERGRQSVADAVGRRRRYDLNPMMMVFWNWLSRAMRRFERAAQRVAQGLPPPRRRPSRQRPEPTPPAEGSPPPELQPTRVRLPSSQAWLVRLIPNEGLAWVGNGLYQRITTDPDLQALIAAAPELGRVLRPILRAFGAPPVPLLDLPKRPRTPAKPRPPKPPRERPDDWVPSQAQLTRALARPPGMPDFLGNNSKPYGKR